MRMPRESGRVGAVVVLLGMGAALGPTAIAAAERGVAITSADGTVLSGSLFLPEEPIAGVVLLPGSGPAVRAQLEPLARALAGRGVATLAFDKRGCGQSGGSWVEASLDHLADDAIAALSALRAARGAGEWPVGFWGHSQGVWVGTVAAARSEAASFLIGVSGGGMSPREIETYQYSRRLDEAGLSALEKARGLELVDDYFTYLETGRGRGEIAARLEGDEPWAAALELGRVLVSEKNRPFWSWVATFDPRPVVSDLRMPVLLVFGEEDDLLPLDKTIAGWAEALARTGEADVRIRVFPEANHGIQLGGAHHGAGGEWAPGYVDLLEEFLRARALPVQALP